jgi:hypothetical protein
MSEDNDQQRKERTFRAVMTGLMVGSGLFLALRYLAGFATDPSLIASAGIGVAVAVFVLKSTDRR